MVAQQIAVEVPVSNVARLTKAYLLAKLVEQGVSPAAEVENWSEGQTVNGQTTITVGYHVE